MQVRWLVARSGAALLMWVSAAHATSPSPAALWPQTSSSAKQGGPKYSHANDFLIRGTVFTNQARSFPGVQLRIRRAGEKKFHWEDRTNSRGEFAIRVPQGSQYEVLAHAKGFADQARTINAQTGSGENNVVFRMEPRGGKK